MSVAQPGRVGGNPAPRGVSQVIREARARLEDHAVFRGRTDQIEMDDREGTLVLSGSVPTFYVKQVLQTALRNIEGVTEIENRVHVTWPDWF